MKVSVYRFYSFVTHSQEEKGNTCWHLDVLKKLTVVVKKVYYYKPVSLISVGFCNQTMENLPSGFHSWLVDWCSSYNITHILGKIVAEYWHCILICSGIIIIAVETSSLLMDNLDTVQVHVYVQTLQ